MTIFHRAFRALKNGTFFESLMNFLMINIVSPILVRINYVLIKTTKTEFFKLDELERSLSEGRNCRQMADNEIIRISRAFAVAKKDQETVPPCEFKIGGMWKDLIDESFGDRGGEIGHAALVMRIRDRQRVTPSAYDPNRPACVRSISPLASAAAR